MLIYSCQRMKCTTLKQTSSTHVPAFGWDPPIATLFGEWQHKSPSNKTRSELSLSPTENCLILSTPFIAHSRVNKHRSSNQNKDTRIYGVVDVLKFMCFWPFWPCIHRRRSSSDARSKHCLEMFLQHLKCPSFLSRL